VRGELEARELVDEAVDRLAHLGEADELADLLRLQVVEALPLEVLLGVRVGVSVRVRVKGWG